MPSGAPFQLLGHHLNPLLFTAPGWDFLPFFFFFLRINVSQCKVCSSTPTYILVLRKIAVSLDPPATKQKHRRTQYPILMLSLSFNPFGVEVVAGKVGGGFPLRMPLRPLVQQKSTGPQWVWEESCLLWSPLAHLRFSVATRPGQPWGWQDPVPLKTLLFILVPLSPEEEPRAAWGT